MGLVFLSQAQIKHKIGEKFGGGIVYDVSADGLHGLVAETIDQGQGNWVQAKDIAKNGKHSDAGKAFTDWYLPSKIELNKLFLQRNTVGGFSEDFYWSSSQEHNFYNTYYQLFYIGKHLPIMPAVTFVRAVRAF